MKVTIEEAISLLYQNEMNCGFQTFWDGGIRVWFGDPINGKVEENFDIDQINEAAAWLIEQALARPKVRSSYTGAQS